MVPAAIIVALVACDARTFTASPAESRDPFIQAFESIRGACLGQSGGPDEWTYFADAPTASVQVVQFPPGFYVLTGSDDRTDVLGTISVSAKEFTWESRIWRDGSLAYRSVDPRPTWGSSLRLEVAALLERATTVCRLATIN